MTLNGSRKRPAVGAIFGFALISMSGMGVGAQAAGSGNALPSFAKLPDAAIAQFKSDPQELLRTYSSAGLLLSTEVRSLVLTDPGLVPLLLGVAKQGNDAQKAAIGAGMAEAARVLAAANPQLAAQIQLAVAQSDLGALITAFIAGSNATRTAATAGGGGGGGGGGSGSGGGDGGGSGGAVGGATGGVGGSNQGSNPGGVSFGVANGASSFGTGGGGGLTSSTTQSTSPSRSAI
jgi:hypothetical protein